VNLEIILSKKCAFLLQGFDLAQTLSMFFCGLTAIKERIKQAA
jgi:hypothetical protein